MADFSNLGMYQRGAPGMNIYGATPTDATERHNPLMDPLQSPRASDIDATPLFSAGIGAVAILALIAMNRAGFRFSFGVSAGR